MEYNYFWADTFLAYNANEFDEFCEMYKEINLPFWMQTRPETDLIIHYFNFSIISFNFFLLILQFIWWTV